MSLGKWGEGESKIIDESLLNSIKEFDPNLILNYNNSLPLNVYNIIHDDCSVCVVDADNVNFFWNKEYLIQHYKRLIFIGTMSISKNLYEQMVKSDLTERFIYLPVATSIQNENILQDKNISFIGTNYQLPYYPKNSLYFTPTALEIYKLFKKNYYYDFETVKSIIQDPRISDELIAEIQRSLVSQERLKYLQMIEDLGLVIYGMRWNTTAYYDYDLLSCFNDTVIRSLEDNQQVYNSSKISINISHPQAVTTFSWRVMDIMASNSCLVTEKKKDWLDLFEDYISEETISAITFNDRFDLRQKVIKLLSDNELRINCIKELNNAIENSGRPIHRFSKLQNELNISLLNNTNSNQQYIWIKNDNRYYEKTATNSGNVNSSEKCKTQQVEHKQEKIQNQNNVKNAIHTIIYKGTHAPKVRPLLEPFLDDITRP